MEGLANTGKGSPELWQALEGIVKKHYLGLPRHAVIKALKALEVTNKGSPETFEKLRGHPEIMQILMLDNK